MTPYILLFAIVGILDVFVEAVKAGRKFPEYYKISWIPVLIILFFFGLRFEVGTDWASYKLEFENLIKHGYSWSDQYFEPGFYLLERAIILFNGSYLVLQFVIAVICIGFIVKTAKGQSVSEVLVYGVSTGFFLWGLSGIRQFLSIVIIHFLILSWKRIKTWKKVILLVLSISVHYSSIVVVLIPVVALFKLFDKRGFRLGMLVFCLFLGLSNYSEAVVTSLAGGYVGLLFPFEQTTFGLGFVFKLISYVLILAWPFNRISGQDILLRRLFFIGVCFELFVIQDLILGRAVLMYTGLEFLLLLKINQDMVNRKLITPVLLLNSFVVVRAVGLLWRGISDVTPYQSVLW